VGTEEILEQAKKDKVEFVSLQFSDLLGVIKEVVIPVEKLDGVLAHGVWFDGSSVEGFARIQESDLFLKPDLGTYAVVPWQQENGKTARFICDIYSANGTPYEGDPRLVLKKALAEAKELFGYQYNVGPEQEFYLFKKNGEKKTEPIDLGGYFDLSSHEGYCIMKETIGALHAFGIKAETTHHEVGQGQYEVDFNYGQALEIADRLLTLKYTIKKIAQMHGLQATFMPKPVEGRAGSGMHVHQSLFDLKAKKNAFFDEADKHRLSKVAKGFIAGQLKHVKPMCAILCPTVNSYKRLVSGFEAPVYITWAGMNRSSLIRVPRWFKQKPEAARVELRNPDPAANPYLAFAVMLKAGLDGIKNNFAPPEPVEENVYELDGESRANKKVDVLPASLLEALEELKKSALVKETLGKHLFERYIDIKEKEWDEFRIKVTQWELEKYLDMF
jgi:glutamine synthetase